MTIRKATVEDIPAMVTMGSRFATGDNYAGVVEDSPEAFAALGHTLVGGARSNIFVCEQSDRITAMLGVVVHPSHIDGVWQAGEVFWWADPGAPGDGIRLERYVEEWARSMGCERMQMVAPNDRVGLVYERLGFSLVERIYQKSLKRDWFTTIDTPRWPTRLDDRIQVLDNVLRHPDAYREAALRGTFGDVPDAGVVFHGINRAPPSNELELFIERGFQGLKTDMTFLRQSPKGQQEPHLVHSDLSMGQWSVILYLNPEPAAHDGTVFWQRAADALRETTATNVEEYIADGETWHDRASWFPWYLVPAKFNRLVMFPSRLYHSRARENYGQGDDARLIQVAFGGFA